MPTRLISQIFESGRHQFRSPGGGNPKTALLHKCLKTKHPNRRFDPADPDLDAKLAAFAPTSLAAPYETILGLFRKIQVTHSVVVFLSDEPLSPEQRDQLWEMFAVPVFEQLRTPDGELMAAECEAHDGLHLVGENIPSGSACGCGSSTLRMRAAREQRARACVA
jgi:hypothetical protein